VTRGKLIPLRPMATAESHEISDEALLAACAIGETTALGALFDRHQRAVYRFISRLAGSDRRDLDDLVQATFLEALRSAPRYRGDCMVRGWLFGIASNVVGHHARGEVRRRTFHARLVDEPTRAPTRPDEAVERGLLLERVGQALAGLPHRLRVVYVMCELEELPGVEVARLLGLRAGTLWRLLHEARVALRAALEGSSGS